MVESIAHDNRQFHDRRVLNMAKQSPAIDAGLAQIDAWGTWFLEAHTARLADLNLPPDQHARDLEMVVRTAEAVVSHMRSDYLARRGAEASHHGSE